LHGPGALWNPVDAIVESGAGTILVLPLFGEGFLKGASHWENFVCDMLKYGVFHVTYNH